MRQHPLLFAAAPWFCDLGLRDAVGIANNFADGAGMLPGHLPLVAIRTYDWRARIAVPPSILRGSSPLGRASLSLCFMESVLDRLDIPLTDTLIPSSFGCDTWVFRTEGEREYLNSLLSWTRGDPVLEADRLWRNQLTATNDAMSWTSAILPPNFRRMKRSSIPFFKYTVRFERRIRADTGYFLAYQMLEAGEVAQSHYANRYQRLPSWWGNFEVCQGFWSELGPILTYVGSHLSDPRHGPWVVFLTEWCVKVAANLRWEAYDCWRLWFLPPKLVELMRLLDYSIPLGGVDSDIEVHSLLDKVTQVEWENVPAFNFSRSFAKRRPSFSPGRSHSAAGDFVWFNAWTSSFCSASEAQLSRQHSKQITVPESLPDPRAGSV